MNVGLKTLILPANEAAMAQAGLDTTTAGSEASSALQANVQGAQANSTAQGLGDIFGDVSQTYNSSLDAKNLRAGSLYGYGSMFGSPLYGVGAAQPQQPPTWPGY